MKKVLDLLEAHVQWLVMGIAVAFLLLAVFKYVISTPVSVTLGNRTESPGRVDRYILEEVATPLQERMRRNESITLTVPRYGDQFAARLAETTSFEPLAATLFERTNLPIGEAGSLADVNVNVRVDALPTLPAVRFDALRFGVAYVNDPGTQPGPDGRVPGRDTIWVQYRFIIPTNAISRALGNAGLPRGQQSTGILEIELRRQQLLSDGTWGRDTRVARLKPYLQPFPVMPNVNDPNFGNYLSFALSNQQAIVQPEFYVVQSGFDPRFEDPLPPIAAGGGDPGAAFDPAAWIRDNPGPKALAGTGIDIDSVALRSLSPAQQDAVRRALAEMIRANRPAPTGGGGPTRGGRGGRGGGLGAGGGEFSAPPVAPTDGSITYFIQPFDPRMGGEFGPIEGGFPGGEFGPGQPGGPGNALQFQPPPAAPFDIGVVPDITGWAWDETAQPGATYRYRVIYRILNPVYNQPNLVANPAIAAQPFIVGEDETWSDPIEVPRLTHVFLAANPSLTTGASIAVYRWENGRRHRDIANYLPGDPVGKSGGEVDYSTGYVVVDIRRLPSGRFGVVLMNPQGQIETRDFNVEQSDELRTRLENEVNGPVAPPVAPGFPGGMPGGPFGPAGEGEFGPGRFR